MPLLPNGSAKPLRAALDHPPQGGAGLMPSNPQGRAARANSGSWHSNSGSWSPNSESLAPKFGEWSQKNIVWGGDGFAREVVDRTPSTRGFQQAGLGQALKSLREIERVYGFDEAHGADGLRFDEIQAQKGSSRKSRHGSRHGVAIASWVATRGAYRDTPS